MSIRKRPLMLFVLCLFFWPTITLAEEILADELTLFSRIDPTPQPIPLTDHDWQFLEQGYFKQARTIRVATVAPENPPFDIVTNANEYEGLHADYLKVIANRLHLETRILRYSSRAAAINALANGDVDVLIDGAGSSVADNALFVETQSFLPNRPVLVTLDNLSFQPYPHQKVSTLAVAKDYLSDQVLRQHFPKALIIRYPSNQSALSAVAFGQSDYYFGDITTASFLIERNYASILSIVDTYPSVHSGERFTLRKNDTILLKALNAAIQSITTPQAQAIYRQWVQHPDLWRFDQPLALTEKEQRWLASNPTVNVIINPYFAPFTVMDDSNEFHGISADILRLIHLRTGLNFTPISAATVEGMFQAVENGQGDFLAAMSLSMERENRLHFTRPYLYTPSVLVVRNTPMAPITVDNTLTLATTKGNEMKEALQKQFPGIKWIIAQNASVALQLVSEGEVDGAINNQVSANYMIDRFFRDSLKIASRLSETPAQFGFAVRQDAPELQSILNKALADIPPREISLAINKWQSAPNTKISTWELYKTPFYWVVSLAIALISIAFLSVYFRGRELNHRRQAQKELQAQLTFTETLLNGSPSPIYVINRQGEIISQNTAFTQYFSQLPNPLLTLPLFDQRHPLSIIHPHLLEKMNHDKVLNFTINNGVEERIIAHWATLFMGSNGDIDGLICGWQDVTDYQQVLQELSIEKKNAISANQAKSTFLSTMSHEIRTPVSAIVALLELEVSKQQNNHTLQTAFESAQSLLGLVGDILDIAKIESGHLELTPEWVDLQHLIQPVIPVFEKLAAEKNLTLSYQCHNTDPVEVFVDAPRLRQIISNYLSNAVKFTHQGQVNVWIDSKMSDNDTIQLDIHVQDTGVGIHLDDQEKLFKPFSQLEEGRKQTGTGLGLVISNQLLKAMQGTMHLNSIVEQGTHIKVSLTLPVQTIREPSSQDAGSDNQRHPRIIVSLRILVVDDHPVNLMVLRQQLTLLGHHVTEAEDGIQALSLWKTRPFDLVITDCNMPNMDGISLTKHIQALEQKAMILGLTASAQPELRVKCLEAGMYECLFRPLRLSQLEAMLHNIVKLDEIPPLNSLISIEELQAIVQQDVEMETRFLTRIGEENAQDIKQALELANQQAWQALASCLHRISGAAQIINATQIIELCQHTESLCEQHPQQSYDILENLNALEQKINTLHLAIQLYLADKN